ncbi:MAG: glycosyltransferase family 10 [Verrucomicrobia bacterium]|jgi:hypothetical protein|nr:glycosyltransferase family 10 [Verrucomicrobiota bacterium]
MAKPDLFIDFADLPCPSRAENPFLCILARRWRIVSSEYPDYLVFTHEGHRHKLYSCTKIFYTQECYRPNWKHCDYAVTSIKIDDPRAFHLPYYSLWRNPVELVRPAIFDYRSEMQTKTGFCSLLSSYADRSVAARTRFFHKLNARKRVDSAGKALNNTGWGVPWGKAPKIEFLRKYKFHIQFENRDLPGWTTEKLTDAFAAFTVPIFWGDVTVKEQFNPAAFIDRKDFDSDEACIEHILKVDADDELYLKYLSATPFHGNKPNKEWDHERLLDFFEMIFSQPPNPVARRRWFWKLTKWRLVKRNKTQEEKGSPTAMVRYQERMAAKAAGQPPPGN